MDDRIKQLQRVFGKVSKAESTYKVYATEKVYPKEIRIYIPNVPYDKKIPDLEEDEDSDTQDWTTREKDENKTTNEDNLERSIRHSKTLISDLVKCNEFDMFATFTFDPKKVNRSDPRECKKVLADWFHNIRYRYQKFDYLVVPEFHKDGKSLHFHALMKNFPANIKLAKSKKTGKQLYRNGRPLYNITSYKAGLSTLSKVPVEDIPKVSSYVKKYITKDMPHFHAQHRFWASKNLIRPTEFDNPADWYRRAKPLRVYENEYGMTLYFERTEESDEEVLAS